MRLFFVLTMILISTNLFSQFKQPTEPAEEHYSITIGLLQGGGSLVGADLEILISNHVGFQLGAGYIGFGGGLNYHLKPSIRSSYFSFQYWHQGIGESFTQSAMGPSFVFRAKKWFTAQLGLGVPLEIGPAKPKNYEQPPIMLMYSIGVYLPF